MIDILGKPLHSLLKLIAKKEISHNELYNLFLSRIGKYDKKLNSFLTVINKQSPSNAGLLYGIPLAIKDNICTKGIRTTASAKVLEDFIPPYDATIIRRLAKEGAVIIGKTNMDAWAHGSSTETSDFGPTSNPWDISRVPGGSSGGTATAVSAYLSPAGLGTETAGSIRQPASWCGVVGLKPTYGRVSRYGIIAMGSSLDCPGPITISVKDAALLLQVIAGKDEFDATSSNLPVDHYCTYVDKKNYYTIGIANEYFEGIEDSVRKKIEESIQIIQKLGHKLKNIKLMQPKYALSVYTIIQRSEVSSNLARYDGIRYGNDRQTFGREAKKRIMLGTYTLSHGYYDAYYKRAQKVRTLIINDFQRVFSEVDFIISPTTPITALKLGEFNKYPFFGELMDILNEPASIAGLPAISVPAGFDKNNLPVGIQFIANYFQEKKILNLAYQYELETDFFGVIKKGFSNYKHD